MEEAQSVTILLVEDDPGHSRLIEKNLRRAGVNNSIIKLSDGNQVIDFLSNKGDSQRMLHHSQLLLMLDLNMPGMDGVEVLKVLKADPVLSVIPVIVLTTTDDGREVSRCYELGCNAYVVKPVEYEQFARAVQQLGLFVSVMRYPVLQ